MVVVALGPQAIAEHLTPTSTSRRSTIPVAAWSPDPSRPSGTSRPGWQRVASWLGRVRTAHAFHSRLMNPVIPEFTAFLSRLDLREPTILLLSNVTGAQMTVAEATDPSTWARQIRQTV